MKKRSSSIFQFTRLGRYRFFNYHIHSLLVGHSIDASLAETLSLVPFVHLGKLICTSLLDEIY